MPFISIGFYNFNKISEFYLFYNIKVMLNKNKVFQEEKTMKKMITLVMAALLCLSMRL